MKTFPLFLSLLLLTGLVQADDEKPSPSLKWEDTIQAFEKQYAAAPVAPGGILFLGSSSIRMWDLGKWLPDMPAVNRGFGGSEIADSLYYFDRLVLPYAPKAIVFYAGDNDIAHGKTADQVTKDFQAFSARVIEALPEAKLFYVPIKPSTARWRLYAEMKKANETIKAHIDMDERQVYLDIEPHMLDDKGKPRKDLLLEDGLHMTDAGYQIWTDLVKPQLDTLLAPKADPAAEAAPAPETTE